MMLLRVVHQSQDQRASTPGSLQRPPRIWAPWRCPRRTLRGLVTLLPLTTLVCGVGPARAQPVESSTPCPTAPPLGAATPACVAVDETVADYLPGGFTALQALMQRRSHRHLPHACEDERLGLQQPEAVVRSSVSASTAGVLIDVTLVDQGHVVFDGYHMTPGGPSAHPASDLSAQISIVGEGEPSEAYMICVESGANFWCYQNNGRRPSFGCSWLHGTPTGCGVSNWYAL